MKKEIVYTDKYALILSDEKITEGDWFFEKAGRLGPFCFSGSKANFHMKKIIAHLPLSDAPILEGVSLLPPLPQGEDLEALAEQEFPTSSSDLTLTVANNVICQAPFVKGYNKAKEEYKYTRLDMMKAFKMGARGEEFKDHFAEIWDEFVEFIDNPSRPTHFECKTDYDCCGRYVDCKGCDAPIETLNIKILTTQNSQGQEELVGKYL